MPSTPYTIALSTSCLSRRCEDGYAMLSEIAELGFEYVELGHDIRISLTSGIQRAVQEGVIRVSSVHNFCPVPSSVMKASPNIFQPSAKSYKERSLWTAQTAKSLLYAKEVHAKALVCHIGSAEFWWAHPQAKLKKLACNRVYLELLQDIKYQHALHKVLRQTQKKEPKAMERVHECLKKILPIAKDYDIRIGIENREEIYAYPLDKNIAHFIHSFADYHHYVGYWHDTGHAKLKEQMGLLNHERHLEENAHTIIGFHLHDTTVDGRDHRAFGRGVVDFKMISKFIRPEHIIVLEFSSRVKPQEIIDSKKKLEDLLG